MKRLLIALAAAGLVAGSLPASADEAAFEKAGCAKCHQAEKKGKDHPEVDASDAELAKLVKHAIGAK